MSQTEITSAPIPGGNIPPDMSKAPSSPSNQPRQPSRPARVISQPERKAGLDKAKPTYTNSANVVARKEPDFGKDDLTEETKELGRELFNNLRGQAEGADPLEGERETDQSTLADGTGDEAPIGDESTLEAGTGDNADEENGEVAADDATTDDDALTVSEEEYDSIAFSLERDGKKEKVTLGTLIRERQDRAQFLRDKEKVALAVKKADASIKQAEQVKAEHDFMNDLGLTPKEFVLTYAQSQLKAGIIQKPLVEFLEMAFDDPEALYDSAGIQNRATAIRQDKQYRTQQAQVENKRRTDVIRSDVEFIAKNYNGGKWLSKVQLDALHTKMVELQTDRGYSFIAPLEVFRMYKDEIMGEKKPAPKSQTRSEIVNRLRNRKSTVPGAGVNGDSKPTGGESLNELGREFRRSMRSRQI
jgi:hypothetical protein